MWKIFITCLFVLLFLGLSLPAAAGSQKCSLVCQDLLNTAKEYYAQRNYPDAIRTFNKVLLLDHQNPEALSHLEKMGIKGGYAGHPDRPLSRLVEQQQTLQQYTQDIVELIEINLEKQKQSEELQAAIAKKEEDKKKLEEDMKRIGQEARAQTAVDQALLKEIEQKQEKKRREIARLNTDLYRYKDKLVEHQKKIVEKEEQLKTIEAQTEELMRSFGQVKRDRRKESLEYESKILSMTAAMESYNSRMDKRDEIRTQRTRQIQDLLREKLLEAGYLNDRLQFAKLQMAHQNSQMAYKDRRLKELKDSLYNSHNTRPYLQDTRDHEQPVRELEDIFAEDDQKVAFIKRQDRLIEGLKEQLLAAHKAIEALSQADRMDDQEKISALKADLKGMRDQMTDKDVSLEQQQAEYRLLEERFEDTKEQLDYIERIMLEKDGEIKELEEQLNEVFTRFD